MLHGVGAYKWSDGKMYKGQYQNDKKEGFGVYHLSDGRRYEGWWRNGKQHGLGIMYNQRPTMDEPKSKRGLWEEGKRIKWLDGTIEMKLIECD